MMREDLVLFHQLLRGGDVAGGVAGVVDVDELDLAVAELTLGVGLARPGP